MANGRPVINGQSAISISLVLMVIGSLVGAAVTWGKMQAQMNAKLDIAQAAQTYATRQDLAQLADQIDRRLCRIEAKLDKLIEEGRR